MKANGGYMVIGPWKVLITMVENTPPRNTIDSVDGVSNRVVGTTHYREKLSDTPMSRSSGLSTHTT